MRNETCQTGDDCCQTTEQSVEKCCETASQARCCPTVKVTQRTKILFLVFGICSCTAMVML